MRSETCSGDDIYVTVEPLPEGGVRVEEFNAMTEKENWFDLPYLKGATAILEQIDNSASYLTNDEDEEGGEDEE